MDDLPGPLHQGLFTTPRSYPVIVRMANVLGEILDDGVTIQRGLSIKVLDVQGPMLPGREGETTQDFVLDTGTRFANADVAGFFATITGWDRTRSCPRR
ncbi:MAG: hypothetical protein IRY87_32525 [Acetobacteraceae bacterium]|nr:hypothetical protein [Acetobacteraceae bacterium]